MTTLYMTEWVIARGILIVEGELVKPSNPKRAWYWLDLPGDNTRRHKWRLGNSLYLTLPEAQRDALARWEEYAERTQRIAVEAITGLERVRNGQLLVNKVGKAKVSKYRAFNPGEAPVLEAQHPRDASLSLKSSEPVASRRVGSYF